MFLTDQPRLPSNYPPQYYAYTGLFYTLINHFHFTLLRYMWQIASNIHKRYLSNTFTLAAGHKNLFADWGCISFLQFGQFHRKDWTALLKPPVDFRDTSLILSRSIYETWIIVKPWIGLWKSKFKTSKSSVHRFYAALRCSGISLRQRSFLFAHYSQRTRPIGSEC